MVFRLIYAAEVYDDLQQNIDWYNERQSGLGARFFKAVKSQMPQIRKNPYSFAIRYDDVRCVKIKGFPFLIHFKVFPDIYIVKVIAVFCTHRNPEIWKERT